MAALNTHFTTTNHGGLGFHPGCPLCRAERLSGMLDDGPVASPRAKAAGLAATFALLPAWAAAPALATDGETTVGTQEPGTPSDSADNPDFKPPPAHKEPLHTGAPVVNTDGPTNNNEGDPLELDADSDDPGSKNVAPDGDNNPAVPAGPTPETPPPAPTPPPAAPAPPAAATPAPAAPAPASPGPAADSKPAAKHRPAAKKRAKRAKPKPRRATQRKQPQPGRPTVSGQVAQPQPTAGAPAAPGAPSSAPTTQPATNTSPARVGGYSYTVQSGDSLWSIASRIAGPGASPAKIAGLVDQLWKLNSGRIATGDPNMLAVGIVLKLP